MLTRIFVAALICLCTSDLAASQGSQDKAERLIVPRGDLSDGAYRAQLIHISQWHFSRLLKQDMALTEACRALRFNQKYQLFERAVFALKYTLGVSWITSATLHDPDGKAEPYKIYYFWRDGGRDGFQNCEVWVQNLDKPQTPSPWDKVNTPRTQAKFLPDFEDNKPLGK